MAKTIKLKNNTYWDSKSIMHDKKVLNEILPLACAQFGLNDNVSISKTVSYGGTQIPFSRQIYNYENIFTLNNGKVYCSQHAIIRVDYVLNIPDAERSYYVLLGRNGAYQYVGGCSPLNGLAGSTLAGSFQFEINANEYITLQLGSPGTYSNKIIYSDSKIAVSVVRYLD